MFHLRDEILNSTCLFSQKTEIHKRDFQKIKAVRSDDPLDWYLFKKIHNSVNHEIF